MDVKTRVGLGIEATTKTGAAWHQGAHLVHPQHGEGVVFALSEDGALVRFAPADLHWRRPASTHSCWSHSGVFALEELQAQALALAPFDLGQATALLEEYCLHEDDPEVTWTRARAELVGAGGVLSGVDLARAVGAAVDWQVEAMAQYRPVVGTPAPAAVRLATYRSRMGVDLWSTRLYRLLPPGSQICIDDALARLVWRCTPEPEVAGNAERTCAALLQSVEARLADRLGAVLS